MILSVPPIPLDDDAPAAAPPLTPKSGSDRLTYVELVLQKDRIERWIRFGRIADERVVSRRNRFVGFKPGAVFAYVRWAANDYGTAISRIDILAAVPRSSACSTIPGVTPGADILLRLSGWTRVQKALLAIDAVEALGVPAADVAAEHWRQVHNRLSVGLSPSLYTLEGHAAWRRRRELLS